MRARGFSLLEVLLAVSILAILASLAVPQWRKPAQKAMLLRAQTDLAQWGQGVGVLVHLQGAETEEVAAFLPPTLDSERGQALYSLHYRQSPESDHWWILATPLPDSPLAELPALIWDAAGQCWLDHNADGAADESDRSCGL